MSYIKVPSWIELVKHPAALSQLLELLPYKRQQEQSFWKEQSLRFGFDIRQKATNHDPQWQSFFYEKFFQYTLKRIDNNPQNLKSLEKYFWKKNGRFVHKLELTSINIQDLELILPWFPNLNHLVLTKCNNLLQSTTPLLKGLKSLHTLEIYDTHLLSEKAFSNIPSTLTSLILCTTRSITDEFFDQLQQLKSLEHLALQNCPSLLLHQLSKLPQSILALDISNSGKNIVPDACFFLPRTLTTLKMNGWDHFGDNELPLLPPKLEHLEIEGWSSTAAGLQALSEMPLKSLNIARIGCENFSLAFRHLPRSIKSLNLSHNLIKALDLQGLISYASLTNLDVSFSGALDDAPVLFPQSLTELNISHSGHLHKETIHALKALKDLNSLKIAGCMLENSDLEWLPTSLEHLDVSLCPKITDVGLILLGSLQQLESLSLAGCEQIRGFGLSRLSNTVKNLSLAGCHRLSGKSLVQLPQAIEELSLDSCELVLLEDIQLLPHTLQVLTLSRCIQIGNDVCDFLSSLPLLHTISLQGCPKITEVAIAKLVRRKFEGTIIIQTDMIQTNAPVVRNAVKEESDIELHPPVSILRKFTNFKARLIHKLKTQTVR